MSMKKTDIKQHVQKVRNVTMKPKYHFQYGPLCVQALEKENNAIKKETCGVCELL